MNIQHAAVIIAEVWQQFPALEYRGWKFEWDNAKVRFGRCLYHSKVISMSRPLVELNSEKEMRDTLLHEIAHALVGPGHHHDYFWRLEARKVGARPIACVADKSLQYPKPRFIGTCAGCGAEIKRFRLNNRLQEQAFHSKCSRARKESRIEWRKV